MSSAEHHITLHHTTSHHYTPQHGTAEHSTAQHSTKEYIAPHHATPEPQFVDILNLWYTILFCMSLSIHIPKEIPFGKPMEQ